MAAASSVQHLPHGDATIAYCHTPGHHPGVLFLGGFQSDMTGTKAEALAAWAEVRGHAFTRLDYQGHGQSSGRFVDGTIGLWRDDALAVLDRVTAGPQVLVGSSMGGWIMLLLALARPERVAGLVGIASAPDFTEDLIWPALTPAQQDEVMACGQTLAPGGSGYDATPITRALIEDGRRHLLLRSPLPMACPVRLLHGMADPDVPWETSLRLMRALESPPERTDVRLTLIKDGDHRLSREQDIALILETVNTLTRGDR